MRFFIRLFSSTKSLTKKISDLEMKVLVLESAIKEVKAGKNPAQSLPPQATEKEKESAPTIQIEHLQVDSIVIEHLDYANNFGQLGIKELSGKLNIGSTYEGDISDKINEIVKEKLGKEAAKVNLRAKKES
ncbi:MULTISPECIES: hypothetical protein [Bacillaceae]|uniref:hypothetical protein n=1 Tax=Bacillaceae TaxID=186817 RepID=UPI00118C3A68|nr:hypothetical protein [Bacillus sp. S3]QCJ43138.1 hypothetical protein FAY30_15200 [Bacillus sp. S3]